MTGISNGGVELCPASPCFTASLMRDGCGAHTANILAVSVMQVVSGPFSEKKKSIHYSWENI